MLQVVEAVVFVRQVSSGRTRPSLCDCIRPTGEHVEAIVKEPFRCDGGLASLGREAIAACLAGDLGLPIPEPLWVLVPDGLLPEDNDRPPAAVGYTLAFGSRLAGSQFGAWPAGYSLGVEARQTAAEVFLFDAIIQNFDRRAGNPNCLVRGDEVRIIDHEATFIYGSEAGVIGWRPPWQLGGMQPFLEAGAHILLSSLREEDIDFDKIRASWASITNDRLERYEQAVHPLIQADEAAMLQVRRALALIRDARDHIDECITEMRRVLP